MVGLGCCWDWCDVVYCLVGVVVGCVGKCVIGGVVLLCV